MVREREDFRGVTSSGDFLGGCDAMLSAVICSSREAAASEEKLNKETRPYLAVRSLLL